MLMSGSMRKHHCEDEEEEVVGRNEDEDNEDFAELRNLFTGHFGIAKAQN